MFHNATNLKWQNLSDLIPNCTVCEPTYSRILMIVPLPDAVAPKLWPLYPVALPGLLKTYSGEGDFCQVRATMGLLQSALAILPAQTVELCMGSTSLSPILPQFLVLGAGPSTHLLGPCLMEIVGLGPPFPFTIYLLCFHHMKNKNRNLGYKNVGYPALCFWIWSSCVEREEWNTFFKTLKITHI